MTQPSLPGGLIWNGSNQEGILAHGGVGSYVLERLGMPTMGSLVDRDQLVTQGITTKPV